MLMFGYFVAVCAVAAFAAPNPNEDGKWKPKKYGDDGKYVSKYRRPLNEGKYIHIPNPYIHINNPYDGGYGPYSHEDDPYKYSETRNQYRLAYIPAEDNPYYKAGYYRNNGIKIIKQEHNYGEDKYDFNFETENKIRAEEKAVVKNMNSKDEGIASAGFYEFIAPDGFKYKVTYTADEKGFRPKQERLETPYSGKWVKVPKDDSSIRVVEVLKNNNI